MHTRSSTRSTNKRLRPDEPPAYTEAEEEKTTITPTSTLITQTTIEHQGGGGGVLGPRLLTSEHRWFAPRSLCDFVIHHQGVDYHVHKYILHHHSGYFRAFFELGGRGGSSKCSLCDQQSGRSCITLPDDVMVHESSSVSFFIFLLHIYYPQRYYMPPYIPADCTAFIVTDGQLRMSQEDSYYQLEEPASIQEFPRLDMSVIYNCMHLNTEVVVCLEGVVHYAHYFECLSMLKQCEMSYKLLLITYDDNAWADLLVSQTYHFKELKEKCILCIVSNDRVETAEFNRVYPELTKDTLCELFVTAMKRIPAPQVLVE